MTRSRLLSALSRLLGGGTTRRTTTPATPRRLPAAGPGGAAYPGDFQGRVKVSYEPRHDQRADPGEIVWAWVPFEEDHGRGKDRPVLVVGRDGEWLLGLMLTSKDHDRDAADEARHGRRWVDIGTGAWDGQRRPSEVRVDRVLRLDPDAVRRQGATLDESRFTDVRRAMRAAGRA